MPHPKDSWITEALEGIRILPRTHLLSGMRVASAALREGQGIEDFYRTTLSASQLETVMGAMNIEHDRYGVEMRATPEYANSTWKSASDEAAQRILVTAQCIMPLNEVDYDEPFRSLTPKNIGAAHYLFGIPGIRAIAVNILDSGIAAFSYEPLVELAHKWRTEDVWHGHPMFSAAGNLLLKELKSGLCDAHPRYAERTSKYF